jgi:hypothetical protein
MPQYNLPIRIEITPMKKMPLLLSLFSLLLSPLKSGEPINFFPAGAHSKCLNRSCSKIIAVQAFSDHVISCLWKIPLEAVETNLYQCPVCEKQYISSHIITHYLTQHLQRRPLDEEKNLVSTPISRLLSHQAAALGLSTTLPHASPQESIPSYPPHEHPKERDSQSRPHHCSLCAKSYRTGSTLLNHIMSSKHANARFYCTVCPENFPRKLDCVQHLQKNHRIVIDNTLYTCNICNYKTDSFSKAAHHLEKKHASTEIESACATSPLAAAIKIEFEIPSSSPKNIPTLPSPSVSQGQALLSLPPQFSEAQDTHCLLPPPPTPTMWRPETSQPAPYFYPSPFVSNPPLMNPPSFTQPFPFSPYPNPYAQGPYPLLQDSPFGYPPSFSTPLPPFHPQQAPVPFIDFSPINGNPTGQ